MRQRLEKRKQLRFFVRFISVFFVERSFQFRDWNKVRVCGLQKMVVSWFLQVSGEDLQGERQGQRQLENFNRGFWRVGFWFLSSFLERGCRFFKEIFIVVGVQLFIWGGQGVNGSWRQVGRGVLVFGVFEFFFMEFRMLGILGIGVDR